jgi:hypothetical protein
MPGCGRARMRILSRVGVAAAAGLIAATVSTVDAGTGATVRARATGCAQAPGSGLTLANVATAGWWRWVPMR